MWKAEGRWPRECRSASHGRMSSVVCHVSQVLVRLQVELVTYATDGWGSDELSAGHRRRERDRERRAEASSPIVMP